MNITLRMIDLIDEAYSQIGKYVVVKDLRKNVFRADMIVSATITMTAHGIKANHLTTNELNAPYTSLSRIYDNRKEAEDAAYKINNHKKEDTGAGF